MANFETAILVARDLYATNALPLNEEKGGIDLISGLIPLVEQQITRQTGDAFEVRLHGRDWRARHIHAYLHRYDRHADIYFDSMSNICWQRFYVAKEVAHLLLDNEPEHFLADPIPIIQEYILGGNFYIRADMETENLAVVTATELLIPWHHREIAFRMHDAGESFMDIALKFRAPEQMVIGWFSDNYRSAAEEVHDCHDAR